MKVLLISHTCQSRREGQPRAHELARLPGIELQILVPEKFNHFGPWREAETPLNANFGCHIEPATWPWLGPAQNYLHWYRALPKILREFQPDIIDLWEEHWSLVSAQACWLRNRLVPHAKIVAETEQNLHKDLPPPFEMLRSYVLKNADYCIGRSDEAVEVLKAKGFNGPAQAVPNAVDAELFTPQDRNACRAQLIPDTPWREDFTLLGYVGRLVEEKGLLDMVEALPATSESVRLLFVGEGPLKETLLQRATELKVAQRMCVLPFRPMDELPTIMNALDALVLPSRTTPRWKEQFGRVIIEAHACGTPVIGSDSGAIPTVIGQGGLVFPEGNAPALAMAMNQIAADPQAARVLGETGREQVEAHYTWSRVAQRLHTIYSSLLQSEIYQGEG
jgi:glycosyltransferase involved in cell wall biosynthesis